MQLDRSQRAVPEAVVEDVVREASAGMSDADYVERQVSDFVRGQAASYHYVVSYHEELGTEGVLNCLFHAALIAKAVGRDRGRVVAAGMDDLDAAASLDDASAALKRREPALADYLTANVTADGVDAGVAGTMARVLTVVALAVANPAGWR
jgi:hypothetical protein